MINFFRSRSVDFVIIIMLIFSIFILIHEFMVDPYGIYLPPVANGLRVAVSVLVVANWFAAFHFAFNVPEAYRQHNKQAKYLIFLCICGSITLAVGIVASYYMSYVIAYAISLTLLCIVMWQMGQHFRFVYNDPAKKGNN